MYNKMGAVFTGINLGNPCRRFQAAEQLNTVAQQTVVVPKAALPAALQVGISRAVEVALPRAHLAIPFALA